MNIPQEAIKVHGFLESISAATTSNGIEVANAHTVFVDVITVEAAGTVAIAPQRDDAVGTGWEVITNNARRWTNETLTANDTLTRQTDAVNHTTNAAAGTKRTLFQINPDSLGLLAANDAPATRLRISVTGGAAGDIGSCEFYLVPARYKGATLPAARV